MRTLGVVTTSRADYGIYRPVLRAVAADPTLRLSLFVGGTHLREAHGRTVTLIEADGFPITQRIDMIDDRDDPVAIARSMGRAVAAFAEAFDRHRPDLLLVLGDRFEMHAAALAALPLRIPVAHLHGGELTLGAIDDALRHSITKLSHLHFVSTPTHARRVIQLGEAPDRVHMVGAPGLDNLRDTPRLDRDDIRSRIGKSLPTRYVLVAFHPETLAHEHTASHIQAIEGALQDIRIANAAVFVTSNADTGGQAVNAAWHRFVEKHPGAILLADQDSQLYFSVMHHAEAMLGNSSSGIIEAASLPLPVVNVGNRQAGRLRPRNVIDAPLERDAISRALRQARSEAFRAELTGLTNPYGDGHAAPRIVKCLRDTDWSTLIPKCFHNLAA